MAILNYKELTKNPKWKKLNTAARLLLGTIAILTDKGGQGRLTSNWLLEATGIKSHSTLKKSREALEKAGLIKTEKHWEKVKEGNRIRPQSYIVFQVTDSVIWKKDGDTAPAMPKFQITPTGVPLSIQQEGITKKVKKKLAREETFKGKTGKESLLEKFVQQTFEERKRQGKRIRNEKAYKAALLKEFSQEFAKAVELIEKQKEYEKLSKSQNSSDWDRSAKGMSRIDRKLEDISSVELVKFVKKHGP